MGKKRFIQVRQSETDVCYLNMQPAYKVRRSGTQTEAQMRSVRIRKCRRIRRGWGGCVSLAMKDSGRSLKLPPNPLLTPLHEGHFCDKPNNSEESPFQIASNCRRSLTQLLTNTKKGQATAF